MRTPFVPLFVVLWSALPAERALAQCTYQQVQKVPGQWAGDQFPGEMALQGDRLLCGRPYHSPHGASSGDVQEFSHASGSWTLVDTIAPSDGQADDVFGTSLALEGDRAVIGAYSDDDGSQNSGAAYVFEHQGSGWVQSAKLKANPPEFYGYLGGSVELAGDRIAVGAFGSGLSGAVYIFELSGGAWVQTKRITDPALGNNAYFGVSLSLSGEHILIGAWFAPSFNVQSGAAYVFDHVGSNWTESALLTLPAPVQGDRFGRIVSLRDDVAIVSAPGRDLVASDSGAVYVFRRTSGIWNIEAALTGASTSWGDRVGERMAVDGDRILAGAAGHDGADPEIGAAYLFQYDGAGWFEAAELGANDPHDGDYFGSAIALDGDRALVGALFADAPANGSGALYAFELHCAADLYCTAKVNSAGCVPTIGFAGLASASSTSPFFVTAHRLLSNKNGVLYYGFAPTSQPFQGGIRCVASPVRRTPFQDSGGNPPPDECSGEYSYDFNARIQSGVDPSLVAGIDVFAQYWSRDPAAVSTTGLTDALRFRIAP